MKMRGGNPELKMALLANEGLRTVNTSLREQLQECVEFIRGSDHQWKCNGTDKESCTCGLSYLLEVHLGE